MYDSSLTEEPDGYRSRSLDEKVWHFWQETNRRNDVRKANTRLRVVKWLCIAMLIATSALFSKVAPYQTAVKWTLVVGTLLVMIQGLQTRRYVFSFLFAGIAILYNPLFPAFFFAGKWPRVIVLLTLIPFFASLMYMKKTSRSATAI